MRSLIVLAIVPVIALMGCAAEVPCNDPVEKPAKITVEMARAFAEDGEALPLFTRDGQFVRQVSQSELDHRGYMVTPGTRRLLAVPIKNSKGQIFALRESEYGSADCRQGSAGPGEAAIGLALSLIHI